MKRALLFCLLLSLIKENGHTMENDFSQGQLIIDEAQKEAPIESSDIPGYQDPKSISEASINENNIEHNVNLAVQKEGNKEFVNESYKLRPQFDLDMEKDPLMIESDRALTDSKKNWDLQTHEQEQKIKITRHECTKGYDLIYKKCRWTKVPKKVGMRREYKSYIVNLLRQSLYTDYCKQVRLNGGSPLYEVPGVLEGKGEIDDVYKDYIPGKESSYVVLVTKGFQRVFNGRDALTGKSIEIDMSKIVWIQIIKSHGERRWMQALWDSGFYAPTYEQYKVTVSIEVPDFKLENSNNCDDLEALTDKGNCEYISRQCVEGPSTKIIEGVPVYSKCWTKEAIYQCRTTEEDNCIELLKKGCYQTGSQCQKKDEENRCIRWQQTYECQEGKSQLLKSTITGEKPFCLDGNCIDQSWNPNGDMIEALSKLAIFREMQKDIDAKAKLVFKGKNLGCCRFPIGFKDCCKQNGWGKSIGLSDCGGEAKELAEARKLNKCVQVGTYCAEESKLGFCIRKKTTFCCYNSKLARLINQQGKAQLGLGFGSPKNPQCEGLTLAQLTKIDFSKLDLSELFDEIFAKTTIPNTSRITTDIQKSMSSQTYFINDKKKKITQGRSHGDF